MSSIDFAGCAPCQQAPGKNCDTSILRSARHGASDTFGMRHLGLGQNALAPRDCSAGTTAADVREDTPPMLCRQDYDPRLFRCRCAAPFVTDERIGNRLVSFSSFIASPCQSSAESTAAVIASVLSLPGTAPMPRAVVASIAVMTLQAAVFSPR